MKYVKIEIIENSKKPEKYLFKGASSLEQLAELLNTKFNISIVDKEREEIKTETNTENEERAACQK